MPVFDGDNPDGWIFRAERFFTMNRMTKGEKLDAAVASREREALAWFQWEDGHRLIRNWMVLKLRGDGDLARCGGGGRFLTFRIGQFGFDTRNPVVGNSRGGFSKLENVTHEIQRGRSTCDVTGGSWSEQITGHPQSFDVSS